MSGWDWLHAGLEIASFAEAQQAQRNMLGMETTIAIENARRAWLEAIKKFTFDISRDVQLAEEQIKAFPQQVYIVSKSLEWRLTTSGLSADSFPDFQDKEYFLKTHKKILEVIEKSKKKLTTSQLQEASTSIEYLSEIPMLQRAISAKSAQESLKNTEESWKKTVGLKSKKQLFTMLGMLGTVISCLACGGSMNVLAEEPSPLYIFPIISIALVIGTITLFSRGRKPDPEYMPLKERREAWTKQLMPQENWNEIVSTFGDLSSKQFQALYEKRIAFLNPILGGGFQEYLTTY